MWMDIVQGYLTPGPVLMQHHRIQVFIDLKQKHHQHTIHSVQFTSCPEFPALKFATKRFAFKDKLHFTILIC